MVATARGRAEIAAGLLSFVFVCWPRPTCVGWRQLPVPKWSKNPSPAVGLDVLGGNALAAGVFDVYTSWKRASA